MNINHQYIQEAEWQIWYEDTFDCECPRKVELAGRGLVKGLMELWARHLLETVGSDGKKGFSRFNLWWKQQKRSIEITGDWEGLILLRKWIFGGKQHTESGCLRDGDTKLLREIATIHSKLVLANQTSEIILQSARTALNRIDFESHLMQLKGLNF